MKTTFDKVWEKGEPVRGKNPDDWRKDSAGKIIRRSSYGTRGDYGWEIDHKVPRSQGGSNDIRNLQPLHWEKNRAKADKRQ